MFKITFSFRKTYTQAVCGEEWCAKPAVEEGCVAETRRAKPLKIWRHVVAFKRCKDAKILQLHYNSFWHRAFGAIFTIYEARRSRRRQKSNYWQMQQFPWQTLKITCNQTSKLTRRAWYKQWIKWLSRAAQPTFNESSKRKKETSKPGSCAKR